ncbi:MAG: transcriptional antiterminator RfaH [Alphaproteobacteria bacterium]|jgi:transcriptional antiterminator RfaH|nr:transcriptional antiterminator RfaH [Alphaproteobacteria bacterium]
MIPTAQPRWYVVQTHPNSELKASAHLIRQGYEIYLPRYLRRRRHARRIETVAAPLFPRYLFVTIDMSVQQWRCIQSTFGVSRLVCNGDEPAAVPNGVVESLQGHHDEKGFVRLKMPPRFAPGDKIRVLDGVFTACLGLYEKMTDSERVAVLLDLLGRKVRVVLDAESVAVA